ncbi:MAG: hypothetical protein ACRD8A_10650 [Candidatus Acidiferrales bacterium]
MSDGFQLRRQLITLAVRLGVLVALSCALSSASFARGDSGRIHWKPVDGAILKLDGKPPLTWSVYQPDKKKQANLVLILLGHRYLVLNAKTKLVYGVVPTDLHADGKDFESDDLQASPKKIVSRGWTTRDIGPAESIQLTLGDYGRVLDIELPHMPDLRPFY